MRFFLVSVLVAGAMMSAWGFEIEIAVIEAAERGDAEAQYKWGVHCEGWTGVGNIINKEKEPYTQALELYKKSAEQGYVKAQWRLGEKYYDGKIIQKDYAEAVKWFTKAAEQGHKDAQYWLGVCYEQGRGVTKDVAEADKWVKKAAEQGHEKAKERLDLDAKMDAIAARAAERRRLRNQQREEREKAGQ